MLEKGKNAVAGTTAVAEETASDADTAIEDATDKA